MARSGKIWRRHFKKDRQKGEESGTFLDLAIIIYLFGISSKNKNNSDHLSQIFNT